jgi:hypothetical protein
MPDVLLARGGKGFPPSCSSQSGRENKYDIVIKEQKCTNIY